MKTNTLTGVSIPVAAAESADWSVSIRQVTAIPDFRMVQPPGTLLRRHGRRMCAITSLVAICPPRPGLCKTATRVQVLPRPR